MKDVTGKEFGFNAWIKNNSNLKLHYGGKSLVSKIGEWTEGTSYNKAYIAPGDNKKYYYFHSQNTATYEGSLEQLGAVYSINRFNSNTREFVPQAIRKDTLLGGSPLDKFLTVGFGVDSVGAAYIAAADSSTATPDCVATIELYARYLCWRLAAPSELDKPTMLITKYTLDPEVPILERRRPMPHYGSFKPGSQVVQWVASENNVTQISRFGGLHFITGIGQEGLSGTGSITPTVLTRVYKSSFDLD